MVHFCSSLHEKLDLAGSFNSYKELFSCGVYSVLQQHIQRWIWCKLLVLLSGSEEMETQVDSVTIIAVVMLIKRY
jgi:hypothetical protein